MKLNSPKRRNLIGKIELGGQNEANLKTGTFSMSNF
jgi:hypothetical protein